MATHDTPDAGAAPDDLGPLSADLKALIRSCADVEEFRALLESRGVWLNRRAAESAFHTFHHDGDELDDDELGGVVGGVSAAARECSALLEELLRLL